MKGRVFLTPLLAVLALLLVLGTGLSSGAPAPPPGPPDFVQGEILVKFKPGTAGQVVADTHRQNGGEVEKTIPGIDVQVVLVPAGQEAARVASYSKNPNVRFAEANSFYRAIWTPNDPKVGQQWQYNNTGQTGGKHDADIDAFEAWGLSLGSGVAVAILDTGIDQSHEDLKDKITANKNFTDSGTVDDQYGHGTHVAGSVAANTGNGIGVAGTAPEASLYNVKVLNDNGSGAWSWIAEGITWSADNRAKVINMSLGGSSGSETVKAAVDYAWGKGVVLAVAAGNEGTTAPHYPAYYENSIAVASTDHNDAKSSFSTYGDWVDVAAPGSNILSTAPDHKNSIWRGPTGPTYGTISGTSMATPHVAGLAALIWSNGATSAAQVRELIQTKADKIAGTGTYWAHGRINAYASLGGSGSGGSTNTAPVASDDSYSTDEDTALSVAAPGVLANDTDADADPLTAVLVSGPSKGNLSMNANGSFTYTPNANFNGSDSFIYKANDGTADSNNATVTITVNPVNDAPVAAADSYTATSGVALTVPVPGVLGNDSDVDGDPLTAGLVTGPAFGNEFSLNPDGSFTYTPMSSFTGSDGFTYSVSDGNGGSDTADVTITVASSSSGGSGDVTAKVSYASEGGRYNDAHLQVTVSLVDASGNPVAVGGVTVSIDLYRNNVLYASSTGTTSTNGTVTFKFTNHPSGTYTTDVTAVSGGGITWSGIEEDEVYTK